MSPPAGTAARMLGVAVALVVCAWFGLTISETHELNKATAIVSQAAPLSRSEQSEVASLLTSAGRLNPDQSVGILRTQLAIRQGRLADAQRIIGRVISAEPQNLDAYYWLAKASSDRPALFLLAELKIRQLEPQITSHP